MPYLRCSCMTSHTRCAPPVKVVGVPRRKRSGIGHRQVISAPGADQDAYEPSMAGWRLTCGRRLLSQS